MNREAHTYTFEHKTTGLTVTITAHSLNRAREMVAQYHRDKGGLEAFRVASCHDRTGRLMWNGADVGL